MRKETVIDLLPGLLMVAFIIEMFFEDQLMSIGLWSTVVFSTCFLTVISLFIWLWIRTGDVYLLLVSYMTVGFLPLLLWSMEMLERLFRRAKELKKGDR